MSHFISVSVRQKKGALARRRLYLGGAAFPEEQEVVNLYICSSSDQFSLVLAFPTIDFSYWSCISKMSVFI